MICPIDDNDNWHHLDSKEFGLERQLSICKDCGFIAYQVDPAEEKKLRDYYRKEYRGTIGPKNLETTTRKLNYFRSFIQEWLEGREKEGAKLVTGDVGCATGYIVDFFRRRGHKATGSEWTINMRRFAEHFYGVPITEELEPKHRYDLISMYHVLEHISEPDKKLMHYKGLLAENGRMMISTPEWLWEMEESGFGVVSSFKNVFHKDHIDVFTRQSLKNLFAKCGFVIEKEDHITYGQTYLLRAATDAEKADLKIVPEKWEEQLEKIVRTKKAIELLSQDRFREAINQYPLFPDAYFRWALDSPMKKDIARCEEVIREGLKTMPDNVKIRQSLANLLYQHERYPEALEQFDWLIKHKLAEDYLVFKGWTLYHMGRLVEAMEVFNQAWNMNPMKYAESMTWICKCATEMKTWDERAIDQFTSQMIANGKAKPVLVDPVFEEKPA